MYTYGGKKTVLSGPDATRRLESNSGAMDRAARKLRRQGYGNAAERMALAGAQTELAERPESGPRWKSRETKMAESDFANQQQAQDNMNAARLARLSGMEVAAAEQRLQRYLNPSTSSPAASTLPSAAPAASTLPSAAPAATPMGTTPTAVSIPPLVARPVSAKETVSAQGTIGGIKEGQFAYEERQRLREQGIDKGYASPSEKAYVQSLKDAKTAEANAREREKLKRVRDKVRKQVEGNPSLYGSTPYTPINPLLKF